MTADRRVSLGYAVELLGLPQWTVAIFGAVPLGVAIAVLVRGDVSLFLPVTIACLALAVAATVGDELGVSVPEVALCLAGMLALVPVLLSGGDRLALVIVWLLVFRGAAFSDMRGGLIVLAGALGITVLAGASHPGLPAEWFVMLGMTLSWLSGSATRVVLRMVRDMRETKQKLAEDAARDERRKLAREVHDVIAHSMTVTLLNLNGARLAIRDEPEVAERALERAERVGRASLEDLRRTVRLLSDSNDAALGQSVDLREDLERLRESVAEGAHVELRIKGDAESVPPFVALTVFRIVQESLTNAVRHSPGACVYLDVAVDEERVTLRVENTIGTRVVPSAGSGRGLPGMFERAALVGGHIEAGPTKDGWVVAGWVPRDALPGGVEV